QSLIRKPYLEVAHFSVEKPAQFRVETNTNQLACRTSAVVEQLIARKRLMARERRVHARELIVLGAKANAAATDAGQNL
ncbi:hypothetical protein, partial [Rhizobium laguerreae]|uniref:hypothetical protein n=1 Tax=Rhizobium laguerreae TaxID=1076926 RepID=UPI0014419077